jgi:hypothetical protein
MSIDQLLERLSRIHETAKANLDTINGFGPTFEIRIKQAIRQAAIEDIDKIVQDLKNMAEKDKISWNPTLRNYETWIKASYANNSYFFIPGSNPRRIFIRAATSPDSRGIWLPATLFFIMVEELKSSILKGDMDEQISLLGGKLIYDKMGVADSANIKKWKREMLSEDERKTGMRSWGILGTKHLP